MALAQARTTIKVMTYNILSDGIHECGDRRERIAALIRGHAPTLLCLQEVGDDPYWEELKDALGFEHFASAPGEHQPALYARLPVTTVALHDGVKFVYFQIDLGQATLGVYSVHLPPWPRQEAERVAQVNRLLAFVRAQGDALVCIAGDFNSRTRSEEGAPWGQAYLAQHEGRAVGPDAWVRATDLMALAGYLDCYRHLNQAPGYSFRPTGEALRARTPALRAQLALPPDALFAPPMVRLDYVFADARLGARLTGCEVDATPQALEASDHLPMVATFEV